MNTQVHRARTGLAAAGTTLGALTALAVIGPASASAAVHQSKTTSRARVTEVDWGTAPATPLDPAGAPVELYTLHGAGGMEVKVSEFGADIQSIDVPDKPTTEGSRNLFVLLLPYMEQQALLNLMDQTKDWRYVGQNRDALLPRRFNTIATAVPSTTTFQVFNDLEHVEHFCV